MQLAATALLLLMLAVLVGADEVEDRIRELRIETVKVQILSRLGLREPPQTDAAPADPAAVALLLRDREDDDDHPGPRHRRRRLLVPAAGDGSPCPQQTNGSLCRTFRFDLGPDLNASALDLWLYGESDVLNLTFTLSGEERSFDFEVPEKGWTRFRLLSSLLLTGNDTVSCHLRILGGDTAERRPYLMASEWWMSGVSRVRRDADCDASESCCLKPLRLSFAEIGFHFIVYPEALEANMCVGKCRLDHATLRTHYERALSTTLEKNATLADALGECWTLCCKPRQLREVRVIYKDMQNLHHDQFIPELSVESCSCS